MIRNIEIRGQELVLHPTGAVYCVQQRILLISDVHLGKVAHFRKHGVALPNDVALKNFERLDMALAYFEPQTVIFLGDLFHSKKNSEWHLFEDWVSRTPYTIILVAGNHDVIDPRHYSDLNIAIYSEMQIGSFLLTHHPEQRAGFYNFSGHIHPGIELRGGGRQSLKLPCFFLRPDQMILPAFGQFTGKYFLVPEQHDCVYAIARDEVVLIC